MQLLNKGHICLVGAGPGDPDLITIKGLKAIQNADVILYDALINPRLLDHNPVAKKIFVGKRRGYAQKTQEEINQLLVQFAFDQKKIVRLKGGDPLIFGRACEELSYAELMGIKTSVVPGISSYTGIAAQHQIPLTKRAVSESLWVTTGHTCEGVVSSDIKFAAQSSATIVVLMGMRFLKEIIATFAQHKPGNYPVAIIQNGTTKAEKVVVGTLETIEELVYQNSMANPANIIFGPAVHDQITHYKNLKNEACYR